VLQWHDKKPNIFSIDPIQLNVGLKNRSLARQPNQSVTLNPTLKCLFVLLFFCTGQAFAATTNVSTDFKFTPNTVTINLGDTVK
jgi:hypothetical protein